jgi:hypothetical protein
MEISASDVEIDMKVEKIINRIQVAREKLEKSSFYAEFLRQVQDPKFVALIEKVISTDPNHSQLQVVLYGVGRMEINEEPERDICRECNRTQLCLAILLRENFPWVNDIVVYDPVLSGLDQKAIHALGCTCLSVNENGRRTVDRPTLFFIPHCDVFLCENVLQANWTPANLNKIIILGNGFKDFKKHQKIYPYYLQAPTIKAILDSDHMLHEIPLRRAFDNLSIYLAFNHLSWHFFDWDGSLHGFNSEEETSGGTSDEGEETSGGTSVEGHFNSDFNIFRLLD